MRNHSPARYRLDSKSHARFYEDEASISTFCKRFTEATIDTPETRDQLFEYFVDKVFIGRDQSVIALYFHNSAVPIEFEDLEELFISGDRAGEVRTYVRKQEFDTSPGVEPREHVSNALAWAIIC